MDFCHIPVKIVKRSEGRSAVEAAAYRSGTKMTNEWDGQTHDYTRKRGVIHTEIMLPPHARLSGGFWLGAPYRSVGSGEFSAGSPTAGFRSVLSFVLTAIFPVLS